MSPEPVLQILAAVLIHEECSHKVFFYGEYQNIFIDFTKMEIENVCRE